MRDALYHVSSVAELIPCMGGGATHKPACKVEARIFCHLGRCTDPHGAKRARGVQNTTVYAQSSHENVLGGPRRPKHTQT